MKDKRRIVKSILERVHQRFNVAAAEVDEHDHWQVARLGICCISTEAKHADQIMARVLAFIQEDSRGLPLTDYETETVPF
ncbi:MAG TPA: DUF503 domain-containing protein [Dehalococcoidia bacterium]|nr:DUF503 domain-containing protein [Dehalococcoidia bacterium]